MTMNVVNSMSNSWWMNFYDSKSKNDDFLPLIEPIQSFCSEFVPKRKRKKVTSLVFEHRKNTTKKMPVQHERRRVNNRNTKSMNIGVRCMSYKRNTLCKSFVVIRSIAVARGDRITSKCFRIGFFPLQFHSNEHRPEFEWRRKIINEDNSTDLSFNAFNFTVLSFSTLK